jgi:hypothetical protein
LDELLNKLRIVIVGSEVKSEDLNLKRECLKALRDMLVMKAKDAGVPSEKLDPLVDELDGILAKIPYVYSGDVIRPEHHNYVVDALKKARDILALIESYYSQYLEMYENCLAELETYKVSLKIYPIIAELANAVELTYKPVVDVALESERAKDATLSLTLNVSYEVTVEKA